MVLQEKILVIFTADTLRNFVMGLFWLDQIHIFKYCFHVFLGRFYLCKKDEGTMDRHATGKSNSPTSELAESGISYSVRLYITPRILPNAKYEYYSTQYNYLCYDSGLYIFIILSYITLHFSVQHYNHKCTDRNEQASKI